MPLNIPIQEFSKIEKLYNLTNKKVIELLAFLNEMNIRENIKTDNNKKVDQLTIALDAALTLYRVREYSGVKQDEFIDDLIDSIRIQSSESSIKNQKHLSEIKEKLEKILSVKNIKQQIKAERLQRDGEKIYINSKVLSDIRPVFEKDPSTRPNGAVITHTLKLSCFSPDKNAEFHVVLDINDLKEMENIIKRALSKDKTLRKLLKEIKLNEYGT